MPSWPKASIGIGLVVFVLAAGDSALAGESGPPLRIGHYGTGNGLIGFVLDRLGTPIKLRFDGSDEILALTPERAPRDAITLKRDDGASVLRVDDAGQILLFDQTLSGGSAGAFRDQDAEPLTIRGATKAQAHAGAVALSQKLKQAGGTTLAIALEAPRLGETSDGWAAMADAVTVTGIALGELLSSPIGRDAIAAKLQRVVIRNADRIDIKVVDRTLIVEIAADKPILGRPSSMRLKSVIGDLL
jgi:Domain of unknown function (DUF4908)